MSTRQTPHETQVNGRGLKLMQHHHPLETWVRSVLAREEHATGATVFNSTAQIHFDGTYGPITPPTGWAIRKVSRSDHGTTVYVDTATHADRMDG